MQTVTNTGPPWVRDHRCRDMTADRAKHDPSVAARVSSCATRLADPMGHLPQGSVGAWELLDERRFSWQ